MVLHARSRGLYRAHRRWPCYIFEEAGPVQLPEARFFWWDLDAGQLRTEVLADLKLEVQADETSAVAASEPAEETKNNRFAWPLAILIACIIAGAVCRKPLLKSFHPWLRRLKSSEPAVFQQFVAMAKTNHPNNTLRALIHWWDVATADEPAPRLDLFLAEYGSRDAQETLADLQHAVDTESDSWRPGAFISQIREARQKWLASCRQRTAVANNVLPPMNPL